LLTAISLEEDHPREELEHERHVDQAEERPAQGLHPVLRLPFAEDADREHDHRQGEQLGGGDVRLEVARRERDRGGEAQAEPVERRDGEVRQHRVELVQGEHAEQGEQPEGSVRAAEAQAEEQQGPERDRAEGALEHGEGSGLRRRAG